MMAPEAAQAPQEAKAFAPNAALELREAPPAAKPRLFAIGDVAGPSQYHLGDEAMLEANLAAFRQLVPGIEFTVLSADPEWTAKRYGVEALPMPRIPAGHTGESWTRHMAESAGSRRWTDWLGPQITESLRSASGLIVSGGGNLCATWPEKLLERVALLEAALDAGLPTVILGQTLGPRLTADQRRLLAVPLQRAQWVGVREASSAALARSLGVPAEQLHTDLDDAFFLDPLPVDDARAEPLRGAPLPWILVSVDATFAAPERDLALTVLASQLDGLADYLRATLIFAPHVSGDSDVGRKLATRMRSKLLLLDLWQPRELRWLTAQAALVISTRYHGVVFAMAAGVPSLGIYSEDYTRTKIQGALAMAGLEGWSLGLEEVERGALMPLSGELWHRRAETATRLARFRAAAWPRERQRWEGIARVLKLEAPAERARPSALAESIPTAPLSFRARRGPDRITEAQWREYHERGYLRLGKLLNESELAAIRQRLDAIMLGEIRLPTLKMQLDTGGAYEDLPDPVEGLPKATLSYRKMQGLEADPLILDLIRRDVFREICARCYGEHASISFFRVMMMNKPAGEGTHLPWHQDAGAVWALDRDPEVTSWIAIDPATRENGCVQVIPGSHRLGLLTKFGSTLTPDDARTYCPESAAEYLELEAGEALLLHNWMIHRSGINRANIPRRALSVCYMDGRTLNTSNGMRYPILFGDRETADSALGFYTAVKEDNQKLRDAAVETERYAARLQQERARFLRGLVHDAAGLGIRACRSALARLRSI